ncbi:MAG: glycosyltransferase family 2 protein [Thermodesulfobacteriota bacterium]
MTPHVSVLMPVYNTETFLPEALASILNQRYTDFELIVIDDASTDKSMEIVTSWGDTRIRVLYQNHRQGIAKALNRGIDICRGNFIARMDADDISHPYRIEKQVQFLENRPKIGACGTFANIIGRDETWTMPLSDEAIRAELIFNSPLLHPTVMMRKHALVGLKYDETFTKSQDYDLWERLSAVTRLANIPEALLSYRLHEKNTAPAATGIQTTFADMVRTRMLRRIGIEPRPDEILLHRRISLRTLRKGIGESIKAGIWLGRIYSVCRGHAQLSRPDSLNIIRARKSSLGNVRSRLENSLLETAWKLGEALGSIRQAGGFLSKNSHPMF